MNRFFTILAVIVTATITASAQRNVLLIIADDLGKDYCGFYPDHKDTVTMPNVRALVANGMTFRNAWANPLCSPTRAGILTGRYSFHTGIGAVIDSPGSAELDTAELTIPRVLKKYIDCAAATVGKWHLHNATPASRIYPNLMGYDYYAGNFLGALPDYFAWNKIENGTSKGTITTYATTETVNDAITWLGQQTKPWFLWVGFNAPHTPYHLPPQELHTVTGLSGTQMDITRNPAKYFKAMTEAMDTEIGRLLSWLKTNNRFDSTDIIFIGDNGTAQRVAQIADTGRSKGTIYQYGVSVPFVVAGPSVAVKGGTSDALVNVQDIFATVPEIMGITQWQTAVTSDKPVDAQSVLPILRGQRQVVREWAFTEVFSEPSGDADGKAIRNADYKLLRFDNRGEEFYHLKTDPDEQVNLLSRTLTDDETTNYYALCNAMNSLLGLKRLCSPQVSVREDFPSETGVRVYPNPARSSLHIEIAGNVVHHYQLLDITGKEVRAGSTAVEIPMNELSQGMYWLLLDNGSRALVAVEK